MSRTASEDTTPPSHEPLAVLGIGCRLPGGADSPSSLWRLLVEGRDAVTEIPRERWDVDAHFDPEPGVPGRMSSSWGGFLRDVHAFDATFFGDAADLAPRHRLLTQVAFEALEHAGLPNSDAGLFAGLGAGVGRVSELLGLSGPSVAVDTGNSSALTALHLASASLRSRECDVALVGAATLILDPSESIALSGKGVLSPSGRSRAFEKRSDGFVRSEGCVVIVLKRLADALYDNDRVLAVIRSSAIGRDSVTSVLRRALTAGGITAAEVGFVETHGSGLPAEDAAEFAALSEVYDARCALGAVKSNLGNTESVSGLAGLVKAVLALRAGVIPPTPHFAEWHPALDVESTGLFLPTSAVEWPTSTRVAAVSALDSSSGHAHVLLEQAPPQPVPTTKPLTGKVIVPLSASTPRALAETAARLADWLEDEGADSSLTDVAYTLARRRPRAVQAMVAANDIEELVAGLRAGPDSPGVETIAAQGELLDLPPTAWDRTVYPAEVVAARAHPLLGRHTEVPGTGRHVWQADVGTDELPWLADHRVDGVAVLPGSAYFEMALSSAAEYFGCAPDAVEVRGMELHQRAELARHTTVTTQLTPSDADRAKFEVFGRAGGDWVRLATAVVHHYVEFRLEPPVEVDEPTTGPEALYGKLRGHGIHHGPAFTGVLGLRGSTLARVHVPPVVRGASTRFVVHPVLLDTCFQVLGAGLLPVSVGSLRVHGDLRRAAYCHCDLGELSGSVTITAHDGTVLLSAKEIRLSGRHKARTAPPAPLTRAEVESDLVDHLRAVLELPPTTPVDSGTPLLEIGVDSRVATELRTRVERSLGVILPSHPLWTTGSPGALSAYLANRFGITD
ncbi:beta-ketoacyl synthase N-terminal-like domain-containing protein [Allokutzneria oryzae]|uniref:Beta-ketoacyl synthase N-terminal-like domain-containing protein n=1 Tax=Allokutzneria oryzae TaxID=1378989 RepID=A0ABV5ZXR7_9PSEU